MEWGKGKEKKKKTQPIYTESIGKGSKHSKDKELFGMKMIIDHFEDDGWYKYIMYLFVGQSIAAKFVDGWHKQL